MTYLALHCIGLHYVTLHYVTSYYIALHYTTPYYIALHYTTSYYIALHCTTLHYTTLQTVTDPYIGPPVKILYISVLSYRFLGGTCCFPAFFPIIAFGGGPIALQCFVHISDTVVLKHFDRNS